MILQTKSIDHPIIHQVIANDYEDMVGGQLAERQMFHYPPYYRLVYVYLKNHNESLLDQMAAVMAGKLRAVFGNRVDRINLLLPVSRHCSSKRSL